LAALKMAIGGRHDEQGRKVFVDASSTIQGKIIGGELIKEND